MDGWMEWMGWDTYVFLGMTTIIDGSCVLFVVNRGDRTSEEMGRAVKRCAMQCNGRGGERTSM